MSGMRRGGRHARASSALRARGRRAHETRRDGRATTTSTCTARVDGARDGAPVAFGLGSADARRPNHPKSGCGYTPSGSCEGATDSGEDRGNTYRRRPRRAKVAWLPPRTPSSSSRVSAMDRCVRVWRTHERARSRRTAVFFPLGKCNRLVLHQKLQNIGSLVDKKCEIRLNKLVMYGLIYPRRAKAFRFWRGNTASKGVAACIRGQFSSISPPRGERACSLIGRVVRA